MSVPVWTSVPLGGRDVPLLRVGDPRVADGALAAALATGGLVPGRRPVTVLVGLPEHVDATEITGWPNLCATTVACTLGHCREIVHGTAVFTGALDSTKNPVGLTAAQTVHVRDLR